MIKKDGTGAIRSNQKLSAVRPLRIGKTRNVNQLGKKASRPKLVFQKSDFKYIDEMVGLTKKRCPKGCPPSSIFMALLLIYLKCMESVLGKIPKLKSRLARYTQSEEEDKWEALSQSARQGVYLLKIRD